MATTIEELRTAWLSPFLGRVDAAGVERVETRPWSNLNLDQYLRAAIAELWPQLGFKFWGDVSTNGDVQEYVLPSNMERIARIDVLAPGPGGYPRYVDRVANFTILSPDIFVIKPPITSGLLLRVVGWRSFDVSANDLTERLEPAVAEKAASIAYTALASELLHSQRQQNLDPGRAVGYGDASAQAAYWEARFQSSVMRDPNRVAVGPRSASR